MRTWWVLLLVSGLLVSCKGGDAPEGSEPQGAAAEATEAGGAEAEGQGAEPGPEGGEEGAPSGELAEGSEGAAPEGSPPAVAPAPVVPSGVGHVENPNVKDMPTPLDMPPFDDSAAKKGWSAARKAFDAAYAEACKTPDQMLRIDRDNSRVGYVSYKNRDLPVSGFFEGVWGFARFGDRPSFQLIIDPLSLNSGDPVRDRKLLKLFFELEDSKHAELVFKGSEIIGDLPAKQGETTQVTLKGTLTLHGRSIGLELPFNVSHHDKRYEAAPVDRDLLLHLAPAGLIEPLKALMASCNHSAMGDAVKLDIDLDLKRGCE